MKSFREWREQQELAATPQDGSFPQKAWQADKKEMMQHWSQLQPGKPFVKLRSIPKNYEGSTHFFDGLRITGSAAFIDSVLSRLKDLLTFENPKTRLEIIYKQQENKKTNLPMPDSYVFYAQIQDRGKDDIKVPEV